MVKVPFKYYWRIPFLGKIQYGVVSRSLTVWFKGKAYKVKKGKWSDKRLERTIKRMKRGE